MEEIRRKLLTQFFLSAILIFPSPIVPIVKSILHLTLLLKFKNHASTLKGILKYFVKYMSNH